MIDFMEMLIDNMPFSIWMKDKFGKFLIVNKFFEEQYGYSKEQVINSYNYDIFNKEHSDIYTSKEESVMNEDKSLTFIKNINNRMKEVFIKPVKNEEGNIIGTCGYIQDITEKLEYENKIISEKNLLKTLFDNIPDSIFYKDVNSKYLGCNLIAAKQFMKKDLKDIVGKDDIEVFGDSERSRDFIRRDKELIKNKKTIRQDTSFVVASGERKHVESVKAPIFNRNNEVIGLIGISRDITERKKLEAQLRALSYRDNLTGLYNRNYFEEAIKKLENNNLPLSIIMGDINGLKIVNDSLGHLEGDKFIVEISEIIKSSMPKGTDIVRWGGDEVVILLPNINEEKAEVLASKIIEKCKKTPYEPIPLSISLGISTRTNNEKHIDSMLKEAEDKLYRQKLIAGNGIRGLVIESLKKTLEEKSLETDKHTTRICEHAINLGRALKLSVAKLDELTLVSKLHDIGKIGISEEILLKKQDLSEEEQEIMKSHVEKGFRIASASSDLAHIARDILTHHENWDGSGYPLGLKGEEISLIARIIRVVDAYDAMINKKNLSKENAIIKLQEGADKQFDKNIVEKFIEILKRKDDYNVI